MTDDTTPQSTFPLNRRTVLKGMGMATVGLAVTSGTGAASGEPCEGQCVCFGKIDGLPELDRKYYFQNGEVTACLTFTKYQLADDSEIERAPRDGEEVIGAFYDVCDDSPLVCKTITKGGPCVQVRDRFPNDEGGTGDATNAAYAFTGVNPKSGKRYGLSNIQFYFCVPNDAEIEQEVCEQSTKWAECGEEESNGPPQARGRGR